jgi:hypothetical protein
MKRLSAGAGQKTAQEMGIPGANIDEWTSGMTQMDVAGFSVPMVGFAASLPWDRSERTVSVRHGLHEDRRRPQHQVGRRHAQQPRLPAADAGQRRTARRFQFRGPQTAIPTDAAAQNGFANAFASFLLDVPAGVGRDLKVVNPGTRHSAYFTFIQDKWQVSQNLTIDLGLRHEYYTPLVGLDDKGSLSNYDPNTNTLRVAGYTDVPDNVGVKKLLRQLLAAGRRVVPLQREVCAARRLRREHDALPR